MTATRTTVETKPTRYEYSKYEGKVTREVVERIVKEIRRRALGKDAELSQAWSGKT